MTATSNNFDYYKTSSDFDVYKTSTDAVLEKFKSGQLYAENPEQYFATILSVCNHFKQGIVNVENILNKVITDCHACNSNYDKAVDAVYEVFDVLENFVDLICDDFGDFKDVVTSVIPKESLEHRCSIDFNLVEQRVSDLHKMLSRVRSQLLSRFMIKLTDSELKARTV